MSAIRFPMIITCFINNPQEIEKLFDKLLKVAGYVKIGERAYVHEGGEQLTASVNYSRAFLPEINEIKDCLTLNLSDAEHAINIELCNDLNRVLSSENIAQ